MAKKQRNTNKYVAGLSLAAMGGGFAATLPFEDGFLGLLQGGFEAGLVGGLADWFAVTALFRHPLGIPIPHTALLPKNREKLTRSVIAMLETELLSMDSIRAKIEPLPISRTLLSKLEEELHGETLPEGIVTMLSAAIRFVQTDKLAAPVADAAKQAILDAVSNTETLRKLFETVMERDYDAKVLDAALEKAQDWVAKPETRDYLGGIAMQLISQLKVGGFMQFAVQAFLGYLSEDKLGDMAQTFLHGKIVQLQNADDRDRQAILGVIRRELRALPDRPGISETIAQAAGQMIDAFGLVAHAERLLATLKERALAFVQGDSFVSDWLVPQGTTLIAKLRDDEQTIARTDGWIKERIVSFIEKNYHKIGQLAKENIDRLDNDSLIAFIEDKVGKDLQWIRINGAICGFLVGLALYGIRSLM
ncbi:MAG: DUF445 domain-containing protein [Paenibacillaceae bacterium]|nr:DUF445 domain-containing protein [Paenibacillaceae bacterium]